jgi:hypothetical protein
LSSKQSSLPKVFLVILALILFGILSGVMVSRLFSHIRNSEDTPAPSLTPVSTPTPVIDETATWETYSNPKHLISLKYPPEIVVTQSEYSGLTDIEFTHEGNLLYFRVIIAPSASVRQGIVSRGATTLGDNLWQEYYFPKGSQEIGGPGPKNNDQELHLVQASKNIDIIAIVSGQTELDATQSIILSSLKFTDEVSKFTCPESGWVDCMPILDNERQKACSEEAMVWYKDNCPNFQGGAL